VAPRIPGDQSRLGDEVTIKCACLENVVAEELSRSQDESRIWKTSRDLSIERLCLAKSRNLYNEYTPGRGDALQLAEGRLVQDEK
jgi:hypothetical protein